MPNYRLTLQFEGTRYHGWQVQPNGITVQEVVERAVAETTGRKVRVLGCGRTDAGVHAEEYVANFPAESNLLPERMMGAINSRLPEDVAVLSCDIVPDEFHATFGVKLKTYRYTLLTGPVRPVLARNFVHWVRSPLDVDAMRRAAECLVGEHDFASFVTEHNPEKDTVRTITRLDITTDGRYIRILVEGNGFLYNMVRTIAGCLIAVGRGVRSPGWMKEALDARDRTKALATAPARGLTMVKTVY